MEKAIIDLLRAGTVIPAQPLALNAARKLDERRQRALSRYYIAAGSGGLAVGVHSTQFAIRDPKIGLFRPVLELAREEMDRAGRPLVRIGGICGGTAAAVREATLLRDLGYHAGLINLGALKTASDEQLVEHCRTVSQTLPLVGFYLQQAAGGRLLSYNFWRRFAEIPGVVAIKMAPFNRYRTLDVIRGVAEAGRDDIALYTGNDDNIVIDLLTPYRIRTSNGKVVERRIVGGLLGHWSVWTKKAVELQAECRRLSVVANAPIPADLLARAIEITDANAVFFDAANNFAGCIPGIHEVLRRQGLLEGLWTLDEHERLSPGQAEEITRVHQAYPHLNDDDFVAAHLDQWLR